MTVNHSRKYDNNSQAVHPAAIVKQMPVTDWRVCTAHGILDARPEELAQIAMEIQSSGRSLVAWVSKQTCASSVRLNVCAMPPQQCQPYASSALNHTNVEGVLLHADGTADVTMYAEIRTFSMRAPLHATSTFHTPTHPTSGQQCQCTSPTAIPT